MVAFLIPRFPAY